MPLILSLVLLLQTPADAQTRAAVEAHMASEKVPSIAVAVMRDGKMVFEQAFGMADVERKRPATKSTRYRLASISKPVTATIVMSLVEEGKLNLDQDVHELVPEFPNKTVTITTRQLLGHLSGIRHYQNGKRDNSDRHFASTRDALTVFASDPLVHGPGDQYLYSTHAFTLVARLAEVAGRTDFRSLLRRRVSTKAGSRSLDLENLREQVSDRAQVYSPSKTGPAERDDLSWKYGGGGMESSAGDLARFGSAVLQGRLVSPKSRDMMWSRQRTNSGKETEYGLGWSLGNSPYGLAPAHSGGQVGAASFLQIVPSKGLVVVVLSNKNGHPVTRLARQITTLWAEPADK